MRRYGAYKKAALFVKGNTVFHIPRETFSRIDNGKLLTF